MKAFYFAWISESETFNPITHAREDEKIFSLEISQDEGEFAKANILVQNSFSGLITGNPFCFISGKKDDNSVVLLFKGMLVGIPQSIEDELISLDFIARPSNFEATQQSYIDTLKVAPYYDPLFVAEENRNDPSEILEGRSSYLFWNRSTHALSHSDIISGASTVDFNGKHFRDSLSIEIGDLPFKYVDVSIEAQWTQRGANTFEITDRIETQFENRKINTLTDEDLRQNFPAQGSAIGGSGYSVVESWIRENADITKNILYPKSSPKITVATSKYPTHDPVVDEETSRPLTFKRFWYDAFVSVRAEYEQKRREVVSFQIGSNIQNILESSEIERLELRLEDITKDVDTEIWQTSTSYVVDDVVRNGNFYLKCVVSHTSTDISSDYLDGFWVEWNSDGSPLGGKWKATFFQSARGEQAIEHAIMRASAKLKNAARCVEISFEVPFEDGIAVDTSKSARVVDYRIPNGEATGKVKSYSLRVDGDSGEIICSIKIACSVGDGGSVSSGDYVVEEAGVSFDDYSLYQPFVPVDAQNLTDGQLLKRVSVKNSGGKQSALIVSQANPDDFLKSYPTQISFSFKSLASYDELLNEISLTMNNLVPVEKTINLE